MYRALKWLGRAAERAQTLWRVSLAGSIVFKPNMVIAGKEAKNRADVDEVAEKTVSVVKACAPAAAGIAFLPGGQSDATAGRRCGSWPNQRKLLSRDEDQEPGGEFGNTAEWQSRR